MRPRARATIVIPAYEPTPALADLVDALVADGRDLIVVDDGSGRGQDILARVASRSGVVLLRHAVNRGKGEALKTAFDHFLQHAAADVPGLVTADADGQHLPDDIRRVAEHLERSPGTLVLGSRRFERGVPLRSRIGNRLTRAVFHLLLGPPLADVQTGLRGLPRAFLPELLGLESGRYEFELDMLLRAARRQLPIAAVPIQTVYGGAGQSHFNPLRDSLRISFLFLRFLGLSLATAGIDYGVFVTAYLLSHNILASTAMARGVAGTFNFVYNRRLVFRSRGGVRTEALKYAALVFTLMWISYGLVISLVILPGLSVYLAKVLADAALFVASFAIQDLFVFTSREQAGAPGRTDWDAYYRRPSLFAPAARRVTARKLVAIVDRFAPSAAAGHFVELGGGNSALIRRFAAHYPRAHFTAVDTNALALQMLSERFGGDARLTTVAGDALRLDRTLEADVVFSTGLVEHFDPDGTARAVAAHFEQARPGGLVVITYPTPTWLYRLVRGAAATLGLWAFPDERALTHDEVVREASRHGGVLELSITWAIVLTQGVLVARRGGLGLQR